MISTIAGQTDIRCVPIVGLPSRNRSRSTFLIDFFGVIGPVKPDSLLPIGRTISDQPKLKTSVFGETQCRLRVGRSGGRK